MQGGMDGGVRVPTVVMYPGVIPPGTVIDTPTSMMDILPTLAELLKLNLPRDRLMDGQSLMPLLRGEDPLHQSRFFYHYCGNKIHAARYLPDSGMGRLTVLH